MMRLLYLIVLGFFLLSACNKETHTTNKLGGEWELQQYKMTLPNGMTYLGTGSGSFFFSDKKTDQENKTYLFQLNQQVNGTSITKDENGTFVVSYEPGYPELQLDAVVGNQLVSTAFRVLTLNDTDLQLEGGDASGKLHSYLFRKVK